MGEVVNPRQQANGEKEENHTQQLDEGPPWPRQDLPALEQLYEQTGKDAKLRAGWADLSSVRKKYGTGQVACNATEDVDDGYSKPPC